MTADAPEGAAAELKQRAAQMMEHRKAATDAVPWAKRLGFAIDHVEPGRVRGVQPYAADLVGDPQTGVIHGGVVTALLDHLCGMAAWTRIVPFSPVATLDLRIDYMRPAAPERDIIGDAECYAVTRTVAFVRATAHQGDSAAPIATAAGSFAIARKSQRGGRA